jgi:hypothetical protein
LFEIYEDNQNREKGRLFHVNEKLLTLKILEASPLKTNGPGDDIEA